MGRRPNRLVVEFFHRGPKLDDSSNRYEHTCKRCGERFPKGRMDALIGHLIRRCPNVSLDDRQLVFEQLHQKSERKCHVTTAQFHNDPLQLSNAPVTLHNDDNILDFFQQQEQQSALDTLAEVSRRHLDYSAQRGQREQDTDNPHDDSGQAIAEQALLAHLRQAGMGNSDPPALYTPAADTRRTEQNGHGLRHGESQLHPRPLASTSAMYTAGPPRQHPDNSDAVRDSFTTSTHLDPQLGRIEAQIAAHLRPSFHATDAQQAIPSTAQGEFTWTSTSPTGVQPFAGFSSPSTNCDPAFGVLQNAAKPKGRNRFSVSRRKEVETIRKSGACMRCRMLKKPCSEGTPCLTCQKVDSARVWKATCIRTKLAEVFGLWSTELFHSLAELKVSVAIKGLHQTKLVGRIEARLCTQSASALSFACVRFTDQPLSDKTPKEQHNDLLLLNESRDEDDKIESYMLQIAIAYTEKETSPLLKATMQQAQGLVQEEVHVAATQSQKQSGRTCYNLETRLVSTAVELWAMTRVLTSPHDVDLHLQYIDARSSENMLSSNQLSTSATNIEEGTRSHDLIKHQLFALLESRCSKLSKKIMNELERRILQRQQVSKFGTIVSAGIFLNCVERLTGLFRSFDLSRDEFQQNDGVTNQFPTKAGWGRTPWPDLLSITSNWSLSNPPPHYWNQGEYFASLLTTLLRMRAFLPKFMTGQDGALLVLQDHQSPVESAARKPIEVSNDEQLGAIAAWLDPLNLQMHKLAEVMDSEMPRPEAGVHAWDLRYISRMLLAETIGFSKTQRSGFAEREVANP
ncbi:Hypothetical protein R9X50_00247900 [Acrodontium crateriforme]|uniref:Uncharacterized protein n=1 Tax=Acrodontium crateriforme TaxID=150365 RepID=A0AAQ3R3I1_9PEZI|nr:Hypothetical protein R9X50_00247900 [Acrodontium crateriforme]